MSEQKVVQLSIAEFESDDSDDSSEDEEVQQPQNGNPAKAVQPEQSPKGSRPKASRRKILDSVLEMKAALEYLKTQKEKDLIARHENETKLKEKKEKKRQLLEEKKKQADKQAEAATPPPVPPKLSREVTSYLRF
jgi:hypothetical protein